MANMASVAYAIEGSKESLKAIQTAIILADEDKEHWTEYTTCIKLGYTDEDLEDKRLGGEINSDDAEITNKGVLRFWAEERWGLQDFHKLLKQKFSDIIVYYVVEESGCDIYYTNDKKGKYFPDRYYVDTCINGDYQSEYFSTEKAMYAWLSSITNNAVKSEKDIKDFNSYYEGLAKDDECFINVHEFEVEN